MSGPNPPDGINTAHISTPGYTDNATKALQTPGEAGCALWTAAAKGLYEHADIIPISVMPAKYFMQKATFDLSLASSRDPQPSGLDQIEFIAKTNPGQLAQPLRKIASGGELSRIMLALSGLARYHDDPATARQGLLFGYGRVTESEIEEGIRIVASALG